MDNIKKFSEQIILEMIREIERKDMPQVKGKDVDDVLKIFDESGIKYYKVTYSDGQKSIEEISNEAGINIYDTSRILFGMISARLLKLK